MRDKLGFTLIELLLYTSLAAVILLVVSLFLALVLETRIRGEVIAEVEQQGLQAMQLIGQSVRNAENINSPTPGTSSPFLSLDVLNGTSDPTVFDLSSGNIRITEGVSPSVFLLSNRVQVTGLVFQNLSRPLTPGTVRIEFTLGYLNPGGRAEYNYSKTFYGSASLR